MTQVELQTYIVTLDRIWASLAFNRILAGLNRNLSKWVQTPLDKFTKKCDD